MLPPLTLSRYCLRHASTVFVSTCSSSHTVLLCYLLPYLFTILHFTHYLVGQNSQRTTERNRPWSLQHHWRWKSSPDSIPQPHCLGKLHFQECLRLSRLCHVQQILWRLPWWALLWWQRAHWPGRAPLPAASVGSILPLTRRVGSKCSDSLWVPRQFSGICCSAWASWSYSGHGSA